MLIRRRPRENAFSDEHVLLMALEGPARRLHDEIKYRRKFPPREAAAVKKSELTVRGLGRTGALIAETSRLYTDAAEGVIEEFADAVVTKGAALGIVDDADVRRVITEAHQQTFDEARGLLLDELQGQAGDYRTLATGIVDDRRRPVWEHLERKLELQRLEMPVPTVAEKEREQKFGILLSPRQAERDFADEVAKAREHGNPAAMLFVDGDHFKALNATWTNATVDETLLPAVQRLLAKLVQGRGYAYRHGGAEFLLIMPNMDRREAEAFAERVRDAFERQTFEVRGATQPITVSVRVALWPEHGAAYNEVLEAANRAELEAKQTRNTVRAAPPQALM